MPAEQIHLVRHGEVDNPRGVLYGRLPGYGLSDLGYRMAQAAADELRERARPVRVVIASPLERTQQSAEPIAKAFGVPVTIDDRITEPTNRFEGKRMTGPWSAIRDIRLWRHLRNPWEPSWGEPFEAISRRMRQAMDDAWDRTDGGDVVFVTHQLPIWMVHRASVGRPLSHDPRRRRCALSSVTSFVRQGSRWVEVGYRDPAAPLATRATDVGAV